MTCLIERGQLAIAAILLAAAPASYAQLSFPLQLPDSRIGEVARYKSTDLWNNKQLRTSDIELVDVTADQFVVRVSSSDSTAPRTAYFTRQWQPCRTLQGADKAVCTGSLKFPLQIGDKYSYGKLPWPNGQGTMSANCEAVAEDKITVPAGSFDAVRIECSGYWNRVFGGTFGGRTKEVVWYAPAATRMVKYEYTSYDSAGKLDVRELTELLELKR